jgi:ATP/maltotriose-dependent transcriptional regulator MalT/DNA-binding SARP family transcriptional activator
VILRTRLLPPRLPPDCLPRGELVERVRAGLRGRLVAVVAGAGYGKSTLLAQALSDVPMPVVWVSCDERIGDARPFLTHLAAGLAELLPGVGARLGLEGTIEEQVAEFANEIVDTVSEDFVIALDDVHSLAGRAAARALALLVTDLPPSAHLALASRTTLPFPLGRLRAAGVLEIGEEALVLTEEESAELLGYMRLPERHRAQDLHRHTEGWIAGLLLAAQSGGLLLGPASRARDPHFDYLAEEVLARQPQQLQDFLLDTAVLDRFTPELAEALSGRPDARSVIEALLAGHLFTIRLQAEGDWYRYHHLFGAFLRRRLTAREPARLAELHRRAGRGWLAAGEPAEAVRHLIEAGDHVGAVDALEPIAERMVHTPDAETLAGWLETIPEELWSDRSGLVLAQATLLFTRGEYEASYARMERAIEELLTAGEDERAAVAFFRLLLSMIAAGAGPRRRIEAGRRYLPRLDPGTRMLPAARLMLALGYAFGCSFAEAEAELRAAVELPAAAATPILLVYSEVVRAFWIDYPQGRCEQALVSLDEAITKLERHEAQDELAFLMYARMYRGYLLNDLGRQEETLAEAARVMEVAARRGMWRAPTRMHAYLRCAALAALERWDELAAEIVPPARASAPGEVTHYSYRYRAPAALLAASRTDGAAVREHAAAARGEMLAHGPGFDQPLILCDLALAAWCADAGDLARELASEAQAMAGILGTPWAAARAALLGALAWGAAEEGDRLLAEALALTERFGFEGLWTRRERGRAAVLLARALGRGLGPEGLAARLAAACGGEVLAQVAGLLAEAAPEARAGLAEAAAEAECLDASTLERLTEDRDPGVREAAERARARLAGRPRAPLSIVTLGGFAVMRGSIAVPELTTGRQKARTLLAILVAAGGSVHRDALIEWLWPHLPPERGLGALHSALYALRQWLEPSFARGAASSVIVADGGAYRLALERRDYWDAGAFLFLARQAAAVHTLEDQLDRLLAAEAAHAGPFLPEWPYEDWAAARRAEVERTHHEVLEGLAEALAAANQARAAVSRYQRLLEIDPECERWHRALMQTFLQAGERALALRQYHACRKVFREQIGVEPSAETRALYAAML